MKTVIFKSDDYDDGYDCVHVKDISVAHLLVEDAEADLILVEHFLSQYKYEEVKNVLNLILSKLRIGGKIIISFIDGELAAYNLTKGFITLEEFNSCVLYQPIHSILSMTIVLDILKEFNLKIELKKMIQENNTSVIVGIRNE
jgi:predicted SAM-dependent methyltransferase